MNEVSSEANASKDTPGMGNTGPTGSGDGNNLADRYGEVMAKVNQSLNQVDWSQMGKYGKAVGIVAVVIIAQIIIKGVIDTINLLPVVPGLLELLGVVVLGQWSWQNLTTSEKRNAVFERVQNLRKEYLG